MAKIDHVKDLPEWFSLEKYQGCECFDAYGWYRQLLERQSFFNACLELKDPEYTAKSYHAWYDDDIKNLRNSPLELLDGLSGIENRKPPVRPLRAYDLHMQAFEEMFKQGIQKFAGSANQESSYDAPYPVDISVIFKGSYNTQIEIDAIGSPRPLPALIVDLGATDSVLKEAFAIWLQNVRKTSLEGMPTRTKPAWDRWARYGLLPYLDLLIWSMETDTHIPGRVISAAISHYDVGEANLNKTIAPLAVDLMYDLSALQALVAVQASVRSPANSEIFED